MPHDHSHHGHAHHAPKNFDRAFAFGIALNSGFVLVEAGYGWYAGSLALIADAGHNLSDVIALILAWVAAWLGRRSPTARRTYGYRRLSVFAALANAVLLLIAVGIITWEAVHRIAAPQAVAAAVVLFVAAAGVAVNGVTAFLFLSGRKDDLNIRGAFQHMAADAAVSLGVVLAALGIMATGWLWLDPAVSLVIALVITLGTWGLLRESVGLALDAVPAGIDPDAVRRFLQNLPQVANVHDLHIWGMSTTETAMTVHLVRPGAPADDAFLSTLSHELQHRFGIAHCTVQVETGPGRDCRACA